MHQVPHSLHTTGYIFAPLLALQHVENTHTHSLTNAAVWSHIPHFNTLGFLKYFIFKTQNVGLWWVKEKLFKCYDLQLLLLMFFVYLVSEKFSRNIHSRPTYRGSSYMFTTYNFLFLSVKSGSCGCTYLYHE